MRSEHIPVRGKPERPDSVIPEETYKDKGKIQRVAVQVLQNEREAGLAAVVALLFAHGARGRIEQRRPVQSFAVVVAGSPEAERASQNQKCRRQRPPVVMRIDERRV